MASIVVPDDAIDVLDVFVDGNQDFGMCIDMARFEQPPDTRGALQRRIAVPAACDAALRDREHRALSRSTWPHTRGRALVKPASTEDMAQFCRHEIGYIVGMATTTDVTFEPVPRLWAGVTPLALQEGTLQRISDMPSNGSIKATLTNPTGDGYVADCVVRELCLGRVFTNAIGHNSGWAICNS